MKKNYELKIYWDDGVTIECRYFPTKKEAKKYAEDNGIEDYCIEKMYSGKTIRVY